MIKDNFGIRKSDIINRRMFIMGAAKVIIFGGIIARLFSLQINDNKKIEGIIIGKALYENRIKLEDLSKIN